MNIAICSECGSRIEDELAEVVQNRSCLGCHIAAARRAGEPEENWPTIDSLLAEFGGGAAESVDSDDADAEDE